MPENLGTLYPTKMASLADTANINDAFSLYHWGGASEPSGTSLTTAGLGGVTGALYRLYNNPTINGNMSLGGNLTVSGNLTVNGTQTIINTTNLAVSDSIIYLSKNQYTTDSLDIGFYGAYGTTGGSESNHKHAGLVRDHTTGAWHLFSNGTEPTGQTVDLTDSGLAHDFLTAKGITLTNNNNNIGTSTIIGQITGSITNTSFALPNTPSNTNDLLVSRTSTDTLTNKTLTSPIISTIVNTGTLTLPTSTDTLVGKATTDVFTNKTFDTASTGNIFKINGTQITDKVGTGKSVLDTSPTFTTSIDASTTTFSALSSATTLTLGYTGALANTTNISTGNTGLGVTKTINIGTGTQSGAVVNINLGVSSATATSTINLNGKTVLSGALASSTTQGAIENDGKVLYATPNTTNNRALIPSSYYYAWTGSSYSFNTLASNSGYPAINLVVGTTYEIEVLYMMATNTSSATTTTLFGTGGTAVYTSDYYMLEYGTSTSSMLGTAAAMSAVYQTHSSFVTIGASTSVPRYYVIKYKGIVRCTTAGTFNVTVTGSAVTANTIYPGSYIKATPIGSSTVTTIGTWV